MRPISFFLKNPSQILLSLVNKYATWLPDKQFIQLKYRLEMGKSLNLKNPTTFQEKIQWLKLYDRKPEYTTMVDKYAVKDYVKALIGEKYIIPTLGIWDNFDDIDFDKLPDKFVLKTTHGGGSTGVVVCHDKASFNHTEAKHKLENSLSTDIYKHMREWPYRDVPRRIIAEKYLELPDKTDLTDYKVFCFNGKPQYIQVIQDRNINETIDFFDTNWNHQEFVGLNPKCKNAQVTPSRPEHLDEMLQVAERLAEGTKFVRVDLYSIVEKVYFGELTLYPASGFGKFSPEKWETALGKFIYIIDNQQYIATGGGKFLIYLTDNIIEKIDLTDIRDYKFFCFNGIPKFFKVDFGRFIEHHANYYDMNWNLLELDEVGFESQIDNKIPCPPNFDKMVEIATILSAKHTFLRVDLYNIAGKIYFGELTFYPASGFGPFAPDEWNEKIGGWLQLPNMNRNNI